jgi:hypothetical protein
MNLASEVVNDRYLKVLIVAQAVVAKFLCNDAAVGNRFGISIEINPDPVSDRNAIFHIEKEFLHHRTSENQSVASGIVPDVSPKPLLASEKRAKGDGDLPMTIALVTRRKRTSIAQRIAPQFLKFVQAVKTFDQRLAIGHGIRLARSTAEGPVKSRSSQSRQPSTVCSLSHISSMGKSGVDIAVNGDA